MDFQEPDLYGKGIETIYGKEVEEDTKKYLINRLSEQNKMALNDIFSLCGEIAEVRGWNDKPTTDETIPTLCMLICSEIAEAMDVDRKETDVALWREHFTEELADVIIRVGHLSHRFGLPLADAIMTKMMKNIDRPYRHGNLKY